MSVRNVIDIDVPGYVDPEFPGGAGAYIISTNRGSGDGTGGGGYFSLPIQPNYAQPANQSTSPALLPLPGFIMPITNPEPWDDLRGNLAIPVLSGIAVIAFFLLVLTSSK